ncbi:MAG: hypothetical protein ACRCTZ_01810 [Sarcina sp.]
MEIRIVVGTHICFNQTETLTLCGVLTEYACSDRCDTKAVMSLKEELFKTKMFERNEDNVCTVVRAIKYEIELMKQETETPKARRYRELLEKLKRRIEG